MTQRDERLDLKHVLVVEDEYLIALSLKQMLFELGVERVVIAENVDKALEELAHKRPDCTLLDINLGLDYSYKVGDALRQKNMPYVFCTAHSANLDLLFPFAGDAPRITKPVSKEELVQAVLTAVHVGSSTNIIAEAGSGRGI